MQLRQYQQEAVDSVWNYFRSGKTGNPILALPTGTGKSVILAELCRSILTAFPTQRIIMLTHVKELIQQNYEKLCSLWPNAPAGLFSAGLRRKDVYASITYAGIQSIGKHANKFGHVDLIIVDECHLISPNSETLYRKFIGDLMAINPCLKVIGLTATPYRLGQGRLTDAIERDGKLIKPIFTDICFDVTTVAAFNRFIAEGFLTPLIPRSTVMKLDIDGVHTRGGEFIDKELQAAVDKTDITIKAVKEALEEADDRKCWLVFCTGVDHAIHTADIMNDMGIPTVAVHSKLTPAERDAAIAGFKSGKYQAITNNGILTTGFDHPPIDLILCLRPTQSPGLWVQMLGRGTRPYEGKENCLVLDFANNTKRLGAINDPVIPRKKGKGTGEAPVKECPCCKTFVHASVRVCDNVKKDGSVCGYQFPIETKLKQEASTEVLIKGDMPVVEIFTVDHITYSVHHKEGKPLMLRVTYYCNRRQFSDFVCLEHDNYAKRKAIEWWRKRSPNPVPATVEEAIQRTSELKQPTHLNVWINKKYPEIMGYCFDGTAFNTKEDDGHRPTDDNIEETVKAIIEQDDDIPF